VADYRWLVERERIARERRRDQVREQLEFERDRETALRDQLADVVTEQLGPGLDEAAFQGMTPEDVEVLRRVLGSLPEDPDEEPDDLGSADWLEAEEEDPAAVAEAEIARLHTELEDSRRRQQAYERYLEALGAGDS
jgi:hypothetical protein